MSTDKPLVCMCICCCVQHATNDCSCVVCYTDSKEMTSLISEPVDKERPVTTNPAAGRLKLVI